MTYSEEFKEMLEIAEEKKLYAGSGNPNAKILIIGKELAFDPGNQKQAKYEIEDNIPNWKKKYSKSHNPTRYSRLERRILGRIRLDKIKPVIFI